MEDAEVIHRLRSDPRLRDMQYAPSHFETPERLFKLIEASAGMVGHEFKGTTILVDDQFAGHIFERYQILGGREQATLGWSLLPELWGQGIATLALRQLFDLRFSENRSLHLIAYCFDSNTRSLRVIEKLGFQSRTMTLIDRLTHFFNTWGRHRVVKFGLTFERWESVTAQKP